VIGKSSEFFSLSCCCSMIPPGVRLNSPVDGLASAARLLDTFAICEACIFTTFWTLSRRYCRSSTPSNVPYDLTIHDYMTICPRIFLLTSELQYCGEPDEAGCTLWLAQGG